MERRLVQESSDRHASISRFWHARLWICRTPRTSHLDKIGATRTCRITRRKHRMRNMKHRTNTHN